MSYNNVGEVGVASELKELTTDTDKVVVRPKVAEAELATCARMVRWHTAVARLRQGRLGDGSDSAKVHRVISRWRRS